MAEIEAIIIKYLFSRYKRREIRNIKKKNKPAVASNPVLEKIKTQGEMVNRKAEANPTLSFFVIFLARKYTAIIIPREYKTAGSLSVISFDPKSFVKTATLYI